MPRCLTNSQVNAYLHSIGMELGSWNQLANKQGEISWVSYAAPTAAKELLNLSRHALAWLPAGAWKLLQLDNSAMLDPTESASLSRVIAGPNEQVDFDSHRTFLIEYDAHQTRNDDKDLLLADLIFLLLLFESHAYIASSASTAGQVLAIQDGSVHFGVRDDKGSGAELLLRRFERDPLAPPKWITEVIARRQAAS